MKGILGFIMASINEVEIELLKGLKEKDNEELNCVIEELIYIIEY